MDRPFASARARHRDRRPRSRSRPARWSEATTTAAATRAATPRAAGGRARHPRVVRPAEEAASRRFEQEHGYDLVVRASGDAGALTNKLVLTKDNPTGDVAFGVDNTFASRALDEGVFAPYAADAARPAPRPTRCAGDDEHGSRRSTTATSASTSTTRGSPSRRHRAAGDARRPRRPGVPGPVRAPRRGDELARAGLPARHHRGVRRRLAGLLDAADGQRRQAHRRAGPTPTRSTSPRAAARATGRSCCPTTPRRRSPSTARAARTTSALLDTCFRQVEYAGVLDRRREPRGRRGVVDFLLAPEVQAALPEQHVRLPGRRRRPSCRPTGRSSPSQPDDAATPSTRPRSPRTATTG